MANFLGQNRLIVILNEFGVRARFFISFFIFLITYFFCYLFIQRPILLKIKEQIFLLKDLKNQKIILEKTNLQIKKLTTSFNDLQNKYLNYSKVGLIKAVNVNILFKNIKKHALKCLDFKHVNKIKKNNYKKYYYDLKLKGNFSNIISFLNDVKLSDMNLKFKFINIDNQKNGEVIFSTKIRLVKFLKNEIKI